ncbi:MAG: SpaA isopeptide-forming pilin-related protein, partial [Bacteroidota bacterium]|nr:SpaA isopeptide-forming pilin-related protein [Bacteroidota bacterium]
EYVLTRTWNASDDFGNVSFNCSQSISVEDTTRPVITCPANTTIQCPATPVFGTPTATDLCDAIPTINVVSTDSIAGTCPQEYVLTRTWNATDDCGNVSFNCSQSITVDDTTRPVITCPVNTTLPCESSTDTSFTGIATATDACDGGNVIASYFDTKIMSDGSDSCLIVRTWTATDSCGNSNTCIQEILIVCLGASVSNFIWFDNNDNGLQDLGETGAQNVVVCLYTSGGILVGKDTTDVNGFYIFTGLSPGQYFILVQLGSLVSTHYFAKQNQGSNDKIDSDVGAGGLSPIFTLTMGAFNDSLDVGLVPYLEIGDFVWHDKNGNGIQEIGEEGIKGVVVNLLDKVTNTILKTFITDANGKYIFSKLKSGTYYIKVTIPVSYKLTLPNVGSDLLDSDIDHTNGVNTSPTIALSLQSNYTIDVGLVKCASISGTVWNDVNANHILNLGEKGINNITVQLYNAANNQLLGTVKTSFKPSAGSEDGYYKFDCLSPGSYYIKFIKPVSFYYCLPFKGGNPLVDSDITHVNGPGTTNILNLLNGVNLLGINAGFKTSAAILKNPETTDVLAEISNDNRINNLPTQNSFDSHEVRIRPNPANSEVFIQSNFESITFELLIFDINGNLIFKKVDANEQAKKLMIRMDVSAFASGYYRVCLKTKDEMHCNKFIVLK